MILLDRNGKEYNNLSMSHVDFDRLLNFWEKRKEKDVDAEGMIPFDQEREDGKANYLLFASKKFVTLYSICEAKSLFQINIDNELERSTAGSFQFSIFNSYLTFFHYINYFSNREWVDSVNTLYTY